MFFPLSNAFGHYQPHVVLLSTIACPGHSAVRHIRLAYKLCVKYGDPCNCVVNSCWELLRTNYVKWAYAESSDTWLFHYTLLEEVV